MIAVLLQGVASFFEEISGSLEKWMVERRVESFYSIGFQNTLWSLAFYAASLLSARVEFRIHPASLPTLALLAVLAVAQAYATMKGTVLADRSTFNFIRTLTMPLLLLTDLGLGYMLSTKQIIGIIVVAASLLMLFLNHGIERRGAGLVAFTAVNAALTISIYKWHITVWNSVAAEQIILHAAIGAFFLFGAIRFHGENPLTLMFRRLQIAQSATYAYGSFLEGFAYLFAPASIVVSAKRSFAVLWSIAAGNRIFHEKHPLLKMSAGAGIVAGIILLTR